MKPIRTRIKKCWIKLFGPSLRSLVRLHIDAENKQLDRIESELHPNKGTSLWDAIDRIGSRQKDFEAFSTASLNIHDEAVFRADVAGKILFTNRAHQRLTGFSLEEAEGDGWINYLDPSERERIKRIWAEAIIGGRELREDILFLKPDHTTYMVRAHVYREIDRSGDIRGYLGIITPL